MDIIILTKILSAALAIIMLGLGLHLTVQDFAPAVKYPKAASIDLLRQLLTLPAGAFALCKIFSLSANVAFGVKRLSASQGAVTPNLYGHLFTGYAVTRQKV